MYICNSMHIYVRMYIFYGHYKNARRLPNPTHLLSELLSENTANHYKTLRLSEFRYARIFIVSFWKYLNNKMFL